MLTKVPNVSPILILAALAATPWPALGPTEVGSVTAGAANVTSGQPEELRVQALKDDADAQYYLGLNYAFGDGAPVDPVEAVSWLRKAAEQGHREAQYFLGFAYHRGSGVPADTEQAAYFHLAG